MSTFSALVVAAAKALWEARDPRNSAYAFETLPEELQQRFLTEAVVALTAAGVEDAVIEVDFLRIDHAQEIAQWRERTRRDQQYMRQANARTTDIYRLLDDVVNRRRKPAEALAEARRIMNLAG